MAVHMNTGKTTPSTEFPDERAKPHPHPDPAHALAAPRGLPGVVWAILLVLAVALAAAIVYGVLSRAAAARRLSETTKTAAVLSVNVIHPAVTGATSEIALPGNTQAYNDTPIYARTSGYLKQWFVDIGGHVSKGQLMAVIETPEVDQQLQVAEANLKSAKADRSLANTTSERYQNLLKSDSVSKQETDVAVGAAEAKQAAVDAAQANVRRLEQLQSFERVYAPFAGTVTVRNTDIGALIDAGSSSGAPKELFRIAAVDTLRVFVAVPETYAPAIHDGASVTLTLQEFAGQQFVGTIARNSKSIDPATRTLNVEVDVNNASGKLLPGSYVIAHFKIPEQVQMLSVPANTLLFRAQGLQVGVVRNGHVHLAPITIGKDNGNTVEVATGLTAQDAVILDPSDSLAEGQPVTVATHSAVAK